jgi:hypothetical protein
MAERAADVRAADASPLIAGSKIVTVRSAPPLLTTVLAVPRTQLLCRNTIMGFYGMVLGILLLPHLGSRFITGWLYNGAGSSVLIAGLFHSMHNAIVNSTGLVAVVGLLQFEVLVIKARYCGAGCGDRRGGYARPSGAEATISGSRACGLSLSKPPPRKN